MLKSKKILIFGASSGIGLELTKKLIQIESQIVWAVARKTENLKLLPQQQLKYSSADISCREEVLLLSEKLKSENFIADVVIINAAIYENDMTDNLAVETNERLFKTNYFGALYCVNAILPIAAKDVQFIVTSSSSAFKGSQFEGAGYAASKAAISIAFESFFMKWSNSGAAFTTIFFGPLNTSLRRTKGNSIFLTSTEKAVNKILKAIQQRKPVYYQPESLFFFLRLAKLLPPRLYFYLLAKIERKMNSAT